MNIWERIIKVDRRVLYVLFAVVILLPQFAPIVIPMKIDPLTVPLYEEIEKIKPGEVVFVSIEYSAVMDSELSPVLTAVCNHLFKKKARVLMMGTSADGALFAQRICDQLPPGYQYGRDIVNFGFVAGYEAAVASLAKDIPATFPADIAGTPTAGMEVMKNVKDIKDIRLVVQLTGGGLGPLLWVRQVNIPYKTPVATVVSSSMLPSAIPYFQSGQLIAILNGLKGAAEYELLTKSPGKGLAAMAGQSLGHLFVIGAVLLANLAYFMTRSSSKKTVR